MNKIWIVAIAAIMIAVTSGCKKNFLDKMPDEDLTINDVFSQFRYAESFLTSAYFDLPEEWNMSDASGRNPFIAATDEMHISQSYAFSHQMATGAWGPTSTGLDIWGFMYEGIRKTNSFLENVDRVPFSPPTYTEAARDRWKGEAIFLRAFYHFLLMRAYGPVPIADRAYLLADDFQALRRQTITGLY